MPQFPAADPPPHNRTLLRVGMGVGLLAAVWVVVTTRGTGVTGVLLVLLGLLALPALWQLGMTPYAYRLEGDRVRVRRRWLPDSRFRIDGKVTRLLDPDELTGRRRERTEWLLRRRVHRASTDLSTAVRVDTSRGILVVSPADPDTFVDQARQARS